MQQIFVIQHKVLTSLDLPLAHDCVGKWDTFHMQPCATHKIACISKNRTHDSVFTESLSVKAA